MILLTPNKKKPKSTKQKKLNIQKCKISKINPNKSLKNLRDIMKNTVIGNANYVKIIIMVVG